MWILCFIQTELANFGGLTNKKSVLPGLSARQGVGFTGIGPAACAVGSGSFAVFHGGLAGDVLKDAAEIVARAEGQRGGDVLYALVGAL